MQRSAWWQILIVLIARSGLAKRTETLCDVEPCHCDAFSRVICNCSPDFEIIIRADGAYMVPMMTSSIILYGCGRVHFLREAMMQLIHLRTIELYDIEYVMIDDRSIAFTPYPHYGDVEVGVKIMINNSTIQEISSHAIQGFVDEILISNTIINHIKPFAFSSLYSVKNIEFKNIIFNNIEIQAFKQFTTENFIIQGGTIKTLPSRFLSDVEVTGELKIDKVQIDHISSLAFFIRSPKRVLVINNIIETLEGDGFHASVQGPVTFRNNRIKNLRKGAFLGFSVSSKNAARGPPELLIDNNTVTNLTPESLLYNRTSMTVRIEGLHLNASCSCQLCEDWKDLSREEGGIITCWYDLENHMSTISSYEEVRCGDFKNNFWIYVLVGLIIVAVVAAVIVYFILKRENDKKKRVRIVMPDGVTYRETEFHIVVERAELLTTDL